MSTQENENIVKAIKVECDKAGLSEDDQRSLYFAYFFLWDATSRMPDGLEFWFLRHVARMITSVNNNVTCKIDDIFNWFHQFNSTLIFVSNEERVRVRDTPTFVNIVDSLIKDFLGLAPFEYGNEQVAWLLRLWLLDQWNDPQPLPNYYGEKTS